MSFTEFCTKNAEDCIGLFYETTIVREPKPFEISNFTIFPHTNQVTYERVTITREQFFEESYIKYLIKESKAGKVLYE